MNLLRRVCAILALLGAVLAPGAAFADAKDAVLNKEGFWAIDVDHGACAASMTLQGGNIFLLRAQKGQVTFGLFGVAKPIAHGKAGRFQTDADGFDFAASYGEGDTNLYYDGAFDAHALATLRHARQVRILADGQPVAVMTFEGTGFEGALDGVIACSQGRSGWWGRGVGAKTADRTPAPVDGRVFNKEGLWAVGRDGKVCFADAELEAGGVFTFSAQAGDVGFGMKLDPPAPRGQAAVLETDTRRFDFKPSYTREGVLFFDGVFNPDVLAALRAAKGIRITVEGREAVQMRVEGSGLVATIDALIQCSRGQSGWWGKGAPAR